MTKPSYQLIAFTGRKGSGKDTAAKVILEGPYSGNRELRTIVQHNFADALKKMCAVVWGLGQGEMYNPVFKEKKLDRYPWKTPRELMQETAQRLRDYQPDVWVMAWERALPYAADIIVCTDYRYPNEARILQSLGAKLIMIERPELEDNEFSTHASESYYSQLPVDAVIINDGTIYDLHLKVRRQLITWGIDV